MYFQEGEVKRGRVFTLLWRRVLQFISVRRYFTGVSECSSEFCLSLLLAHSGAQLKSSHNIRLLCGDPLTLCRQGTAGLRGGIMANPERLQTAMSLYSTKLSCMILIIDRDLGGQSEMERSKTG